MSTLIRFLPVFGLTVLLACSETAPKPSTAETAPAAAPASSDVNAQVDAAVRKHLSRRSDLDMTAMDMTVRDVQVAGDEADATVGFQVKGSPESAMSMQYHLIKQGGEWVVQPKPPADHGAAPPPAQQGLPPGHPPSGGEAPPAQKLPPGHPPVAQ
ncbi:MAG: hypothetical protein R2748_14660 [Bryobacterales bacterium]